MTVKSPEWHKKILDKRYKEYKDGKLKLYDWKTVRDYLRKKYKKE